MNSAENNSFTVRASRSPVFWILSLVLAGIGARLWIINTFSTPLPYWDSWEDARRVFSPYFEGKLSWKLLFSAHSEHRVFFLRLNNLALLLLDGQWNNQVQAVVSAFFYPAGLAAFGCLLARLVGRKFWPLIALLIFVELVLPFTWENTVGGYHSVLYTMILSSLLTIWLLGFHAPGSWRWWCGVVVGVCCLFTMGGLLSSAAVVGLAGMRILRTPRDWRQHWPTLVAGLVVVGIGLSLTVKVPYHQVLKAHSVGQFAHSLGQYLAWPWLPVPPYALFNLFPILFIAWIYFRDRTAEMKAEEFVLSIAGWAGLIAAASAYTRGGSGEPFPPWRHMDSSSFLMVANVLSLILLISRHWAKLPLPRYFRLAVVLWVAVCATGILLLSGKALMVDLPVRQTNFRIQMLKARAYLATGEKHYLVSSAKEHYARHAAPDEPQDHAQAMINMINLPHIRSLLPSCVRDPVSMVAKTAEGFGTNDNEQIHPHIPGEVAWSSPAASSNTTSASFESRPISKTKFPFLEFRVAGELGRLGESLAVVDLKSGKSTAVTPRNPSGNQWQIVRVKSPPGDFQIVAKHKPGSGWFAFQAPREVGWLTVISGWVMSAGPFVFFSGLAVFLFEMVTALRNRRASQAIHLVSSTPARS